MAEKFRNDCHMEMTQTVRCHKCEYNSTTTVKELYVEARAVGSKGRDIPTIVSNITEEEDLKDAICTRDGFPTTQIQIIAAYAELIQREANKNGTNVLVISSHFMKKLQQGGVANWYQKVDLLDQDLIITLINHAGCHWTLLVVDMKAKQAQYYDSYIADCKASWHALKSFIDARCIQQKKPRIDWENWKYKQMTAIPKQTNGRDCGMFVCQFALNRVRETAMNFQQDDMPALRTIVTEELLTGVLLECRTREHILATLRKKEVSKGKWAKTYSLSLKRSAGTVSAVPTQLTPTTTMFKQKPLLHKPLGKCMTISTCTCMQPRAQEPLTPGTNSHQIFPVECTKSASSNDSCRAKKGVPTTPTSLPHRKQFSSPTVSVTLPDSTSVSFSVNEHMKRSPLKVIQPLQIKSKLVSEPQFSTTHLSANVIKQAACDQKSASTPLEQKPSKSCANKYQCHECLKSFSSRSGLRRHINSQHLIMSEDGLLSCGEQGCTFRCKTPKKLRVHLQTLHNITTKTCIYTFKTAEDFSSWKSKIEKETNSNYIKTTGEKANSCNSVTYYYCNRSGYLCSKTSNGRQQKSQGTAKLNAYCTSAIVCRKNEGSAHALEVEYCATHYGHSQSLGHLRLQHSDRLEIAGKLFQGITFERILDDIRDRVDQSIHRIHHTTRKDIANIQRAYGLRVAQRHKDDATSVMAWIRNNKKITQFYCTNHKGQSQHRNAQAWE